MFSLLVKQRLGLRAAMPQRLFSSTSSSSTSPSSTPSRGGGGAGLFQRISSFLVGAGLTALATQYYIYEEVRAGNKEMLHKQREIEARLLKLENKS